MVADAVDDSVAFEIYGEFPIIPAGDRRLANGRVLLVGEPETVQDLDLGSQAYGSILVERYSRPDVAAATGAKSSEDLGFEIFRWISEFGDVECM